jgi:leader peptidase (prepilin peptidase)/N-methyltransferase
VTALLLGAVVGSFLNVVTARLPRRESLLTPPSQCPACRSPIRWHDNIPILSFLWLKGRCRECRASIPWRYPLVEAVTAGLFWLAVWRIGVQIDLVPALAFLSALVAITAIDLDHQVIPDRITLPGIPLGLLANLLTKKLSLWDSVVGILAGGGIFFVIILVSRGGMGGGDMKLGAMIGAYLGWKLTILTIFLAVFVGGAIAVWLLLMRARGRKDPVPFGPFLALGSAASLFWGKEILSWYLRGFTN